MLWLLLHVFFGFFWFHHLSSFGFVLFFIFVFVFWGGFKGQVRWSERGTSLGPKPSLFVLVCFSCFDFFLLFFLLLLFFCFFPPHLALNPPYLFWFVCCVFGLLEGKPNSSPKRAFLLISDCRSLFLHSFLFNFLFASLFLLFSVFLALFLSFAYS